MKYNLAILASGSGTNTQNIAEYFENNPEISVRLIASNKSNAFAISEKLGLDSLMIGRGKEFLTNEGLRLKDMLKGIEGSRTKSRHR